MVNPDKFIVNFIRQVYDDRTPGNESLRQPVKASIKLYKNDGIRNGVYPVKLIVSHQKKIKRKTIAHASEHQWDHRKELPLPSHDDFEALYGFIMEARLKASQMAFRNLTDLEAAMNYLESVPHVSADFYAFGEAMVKQMRSEGRSGNADVYMMALNNLKDFRPKLRFEDITSVLLEEYKASKKASGVKNSSLRTYLAEIRAIYNKAVRLGRCEDRQPFKGVFHGLKVNVRRQKNEYLDRENLDKLLTASGLPLAQKRARDFAVLQFYLCGVDLMDIYYLKWEQISGSRVWLKRSKLGDRGYEFDVLLIPEAMEIIDFWKNDKRSEYVFPWDKDPERYKTWRRRHVHSLAIVQKKCGIQVQPMGGNLGVKVMRKTFATLAKFQGIDSDIIRELMGHERNDVDTAYKDKFPQEVRDRAQRSVIFFES